MDSAYEYEVIAYSANGDMLYLNGADTDAEMTRHIGGDRAARDTTTYVSGLKHGYAYLDHAGRFTRRSVALILVRHANGAEEVWVRAGSGELLNVDNSGNPITRDNPQDLRGTHSATDTRAVPVILANTRALRRKATVSAASSEDDGHVVSQDIETTAVRGIPVVTAAELSSGAMPRLLHKGPRHAGGKTVMEAFGHEGRWFTVPGDFPTALPEEYHQVARTYAVYRDPTIVAGAWVWVVRERKGAAPLGSSASTRSEALEEALAEIARRRVAAAVERRDTRNAVLSLPPVAVVRMEGLTDGEGRAVWVAHVKCLCEKVADAVEFGSLADAAAQWLDVDPATPWRLCERSTRLLRIFGSYRWTHIYDTGRDHTGAAVVMFNAPWMRTQRLADITASQI